MALPPSLFLRCDFRSPRLSHSDAYPGGGQGPAGETGQDAVGALPPRAQGQEAGYDQEQGLQEEDGKSMLPHALSLLPALS